MRVFALTNEEPMAKTDTALLADILRREHQPILAEWARLQLDSMSTRRELMSEAELAQQSREFLSTLATAVGTDERFDAKGPIWTPVREFLGRISESRARQGFSPGETATFVFSLKEPVFNRLRSAAKDSETLASEVWKATLILDSLGLYTIEVHQKSRESVILRQQQEMLELSTPVVTLWDGILALPLIGTLDSARTQVVMENLLQRIVDSGSSIAILDITGVPTVDTLVAQHLLKTVAAARLMGADCIISGIRPQIAQTIVHLGVDLNSVTTKASLADAFATALKRLSLKIVKTAAAAGAAEDGGARPPAGSFQ
jgi:rsbT co-antagonist protein RsbR